MLSYIYGKLLQWFLKTNTWKIFGKICAVTNLRPFGYTYFPIDDYFKIVDKAEPDHYYIFLSTDTRTISAILIKWLVGTTDVSGLFSHGGLINFNGDRNTTIMHVNHAGFRNQSLLAHLKEVDYFAVIKIPVKDGSDEVIKERITAIKNRAPQIEYDWAESLGNDENKIYCTEMLYLIFKDLVDNPNFEPREILHNLYFDPDVLLKVGELIYCNHPQLPKN